MNIKKRIKKYLGRGVGVNILFGIFFVLFFVYSVSLVYPFIWSFLNALKTNEEYWTNSFNLAANPDFGNFIKAFTELKVAKSNPLEHTNYLEMLVNSCWFTFLGAFLNTFCSVMVAYALSKYSFKGAGIIYAVAIFSMIIPIVGSLPAMYRLVYSLGIDNSPIYLVTACGGFGFSFIVMYGFFKNISWTYAEAAFIDGASNTKVFLRVMLPQARAAFVSLFIIASMARWNDYMTPLLFLNDYATISTGLFVFKNSPLFGSNMPVYYAALLISVLPIVIIFVAFQDTIMSNTVAGGLKG